MEEPREPPPPFTGGGDESHRHRAGGAGARSWRGTTSGRARGPRLVVFVVGGMCYAEARCAHELSRRYGVEVLVRARARAA